jgi:hypothetical protein
MSTETLATDILTGLQAQESTGSRTLLIHGFRIQVPMASVRAVRISKH